MAAASLIENLIANRFAKLAGLRISGTIPLQQELVNEALSELVQNWSAAGTPPPEPPPAPENPRLTLPAILGLVRKIEVRADPGVIHVDFDIGV